MLLRSFCTSIFWRGQQHHRQFTTKRIIDIYTDGSCYYDKKANVSGGYAVYFPGAEHPTICETVNMPLITSNRCEILGVHRALTICNDKFRGITCHIYTDSMYVINVLYRFSPLWRENGWIKSDGSAVKNKDLLEKMCIVFDDVKNDVSVKHVKAHTGKNDVYSRNNSIVDMLAKSKSRK